MSHFNYWGKARQLNDKGEPYHLLSYHCLDVAAVACAFVGGHPSLRRHLMIATKFTDEESLSAWLGFWVALHDLGKFSEAFQSQRADLFFRLRGRPPLAAKSYRLRHDSLGMLFWQEVLADVAVDASWFGLATKENLDGLNWWARAVMGHHGQPPEVSSGWGQYFHKQDDRDAILDFVTELRALFFPKDSPSGYVDIDASDFWRCSRDLSWWIAGLTVLADWLGSNTEYFPYRTEVIPLAEYWAEAKCRAVRALDASDVLPSESRAELSFAELFPAIRSPSPLQAWAASVPLETGPQIYMLEDVTGAGKTEASIILAHRLMATGCANGFFIGLPTMATANAMYGRIAHVYSSLFANNTSLVLAHGQRNLVEAFADSVIPAGPSDSDPAQQDDTATARCAAWLADHNKRALMAPAGVGTIDQALLAVLHSKHQSIRLLGLFGKVLIVDEVHACDTYMQGVLERLLEFHAKAGGSAILLSATLTSRMKQALLDAFAKGGRAEAPALQSGALTPYPLVTGWSVVASESASEIQLATRPDVRRDLSVHYVSDESEVVAGITEALNAGKCVCWIRNTVAC